MLIEYMKARWNFPLAYWADRLYQSISFAKDIYGLEKNSRSVA